MDHSEAVKQMAAEKYLLNELPPDARDAFEEHFFDCPDCALDLRAAAAFVNEARTQLPELTASQPDRVSHAPRPKQKRTGWLSWWSPAIAAPVFATLLLVIGYQNFVTYPALRQSADQPHLFATASIHGATRGAHLPVTANRKQGLALPIELDQQPGFASYAIDLYDPQGKLAFTGIAAAPAANADQHVTLAVPGAILQPGSYTVSVSGVSTQGQHTSIDRYSFDLNLTD